MDNKKSLNSVKFQVVKGILDNIISGNSGAIPHLEISFFTYFNGVIMPDYLKKSYPDQILIVLQHQFQNLKTYEDKFSVTLSFSEKQEEITVPFYAISKFRNKISGETLVFDKFSLENDQNEKHEKLPGKLPGNSIISIDQLRDK